MKDRDIMNAVERAARERRQQLEHVSPDQIRKRAADEIQRLERSIEAAKKTIEQAEAALPFWRKVAQA